MHSNLFILCIVVAVGLAQEVEHNGPIDGWFYLESPNGKVLTIRDEKLHIYYSYGSKSQLWKLDDQGRLISRSGFACEVQNSNSHPKVLASKPNDKINQKWRVEGNIVQSSMNGLVLDILYGRTDVWADVSMYPLHGTQNQKWNIVDYEKYFFLVNQKHGQFLDTKGTGNGYDVALYDQSDSWESTQLWNFDTEGRLVCKAGYAADIKESKRSQGAGVHIWDKSDSPKQVWMYQDGRIRSTLYDSRYVMDFWEGTNPNIHVWSESEEPSQQWMIVPKNLLNEYRMMQAYYNPVTKATYLKKLIENYFWSVSGYSTVDDFERGSKDTIDEIEKSAKTLDKVARDTGTADVYGGYAGVLSGLMFFGGIIAAPITGGSSLLLTGIGSGVGIGSAATTITSDIISHSWDTHELAKVKKEVLVIRGNIIRLQTFINMYVEALDEADKFLNTTEGKEFMANILKTDLVYNDIKIFYGTIAKGAWNVYKTVDTAITYSYGFKFFKDMRNTVFLLRADIISQEYLRLLSKNVAKQITRPANFVLEWAAKKLLPETVSKLLRAGTKVSATIGGIFSGVSVAFGIWDMVDGFDKYDNGSKLAKEFRKTSNNLKETTEKLAKIVRDLQE